MASCKECGHSEVCFLAHPEGSSACCEFVDRKNYVEVVRCKDCEYFKPAHFKADDGTETPWDETFNWDDRSDGIYHGGKCKHERNTAYGQKDMAFRKPDDFCSYGERRL